MIKLDNEIKGTRRVGTRYFLATGLGTGLLSGLSAAFLIGCAMNSSVEGQSKKENSSTSTNSSVQIAASITTNSAAEKKNLQTSPLLGDPVKLPPASAKKIDFKKDIQPIFAKSCMDCHDSGTGMGGFRLEKREEALKGGDSGKAILPGKSDKSSLIHYVAQLVKDLEMPPKGSGDPLSKDQIGLLRAWIDQGAKWSE